MADSGDLVAGRYRLLRPVGSGGMGRVWLARDEMLDRDVAVKEFVPPSWMTDEDRDRLRIRTLKEARTASRLNHPAVVQIYDVVHADDLPWIVMEYVASRSLFQVVREDGPLAPTAAARIGLAVLAALTAAHEAGVLHRDVKPHNVLIGDDGRVVLTDFGLATFVDDGGVTGPGLVVGSPHYVSPERARDGSSTVASDLWSLGATLYTAVEGRSPYSRETSMATLLALATEPPDPPARAGALRPVLAGLLRHDPAERLTAEALGEQLRLVVAEPEPVVRVPRQRRGRPAIARATVPAPSPRPADGPDDPVRSRHRPAAPGDPAPGTWPGGPRATREPPVRRRRGLMFGSMVAATAVFAAGGAGIGAQHWFDDADPGQSASTTVAAASSQAPVVVTGAFSPRVCAQPAPGDLPRTPQRGAPRTAANGYAMPAGWSYHVTGDFSVAVPDGWTYRQVGTTVCFQDPEGVRVLSVDPARRAGTDPVTACRTEAKRLTDANLLPGYREIGIDRVTYFGRAARWEYQYRDAGTDAQLHATTRWFASGDRAYAVGWVTRVFDWPSNRAYHDMIMSSFAPASRR